MGKLIALEGLDGAGKSTQSILLSEHIKRLGKSARIISFPDYESESSALVKLYLSGGLGESASDTNAYAASSFFAADRYISYVNDWKSEYEKEDMVIIANRYTTANAYHQLSKLEKTEWDSFLLWLEDYEYVRLGLPRPDRVVLLSTPPEYSGELIEKRCRETGAAKDIHEKDKEYLRSCWEAAKYVSEKSGWKVIECTENEKLMSKEKISMAVLSCVKDLL